MNSVYICPIPSFPSPMNIYYRSYQLLAVQCDVDWYCSSTSDGMIIPRSHKYMGPLRYHLSPCGYTVTCLLLDQ